MNMTTRSSSWLLLGLTILAPALGGADGDAGCNGQLVPIGHDATGGGGSAGTGTGAGGTAGRAGGGIAGSGGIAGRAGGGGSAGTANTIDGGTAGRAGGGGVVDSGNQQCGKVTCPADQVCCNASCGVCTPPGFACTQQACVGDCTDIETAMRSLIAANQSCAVDDDCTMVSIGCLPGPSCTGSEYINRSLDQATLSRLEGDLNQCINGDRNQGCPVCLIADPLPACVKGVCRAKPAVPVDPCAGKKCGDTCSNCLPNQPCLAILEYCDANGVCGGTGGCP
jgi:hypothetical protein